MSQFEDDPNVSLECEICGTRDFYEQAGFYYCSVCQTQSQELRHFEEEETFFSGYQTRLAVLRDDKKKDDSEPGQRVSTWEVYNLVLKVWTDKLIEMGFPPVLKDKVFQLYAGYLVKRKAILTLNRFSAVTQNEPIQNIYALYDRKPPKLPIRGKRRLERIAKRDAAASGAFDPTVSASIAKRRKTKAKRTAFEQEYAEHASQAVDTDVLDEYAVDKPAKKPKLRKCPDLQPTNVLFKISKALKEHVQTANILQSVPRNKPQSIINRYITKLLIVEHFSMKSVLVLLFVALRQIGCKVLFSDIHRLFSEGTLLFDSLAAVLPTEDLGRLNLSHTNLGVLTNSIGSISSFADTIDLFLTYMGIKNFPSPKYEDFFSKFTEDFVLPYEFDYLVQHVSKALRMQNRKKRLWSLGQLHQKYLPEVSILAIIILVFQMLFGLDDTTERYQSQFAKLVNQLIDNEAEDLGTNEDKLFVLEDWFSFIRYRETVINHELMPSTSRNPGLVPNARNVQYSMNEFGGGRGKLYNHHEKECDDIKSMFHEICNELNDGNEIPKLPRYKTPRLPKQDIIKTYLDSYPNVSHEDFNVDKLKQNFFKRRIDFVYNPERYISLLNKAGYKVKVIRGDAINCKRRVFKEKTIPLFQPYRKVSSTVNAHFHYSPSETTEFLYSLASSVLGDSDQTLIKRHLIKFALIFRRSTLSIIKKPRDWFR